VPQPDGEGECGMEGAAPGGCGGAEPGVLRPALEPSAQDRPGAAGAEPEEAPAMMRGLEPLCWEERLGELELLRLGKSRLWGDLRAAARAWRER